MLKRFLAVAIVVLLVLAGFQARSLRLMRGEIARLQAASMDETRAVALRQFTPERHDEAIRALQWLDAYARATEGLQRPDGLCAGGRLDVEGVAWLFDWYWKERVAGASEELARLRLIEAIKRTPEWAQKHGGE